MPTGYTAELMDKGQDFRTFVLLCARAFGATVMQRDDPMDEPPKKQEPSDHYAKALANARKEATRLRSMNAAQRLAHGAYLRAEAISIRRNALARDLAENARLDAMAERVRAWTQPSDEHKGLKDFMLDQITISRNDTAYSEKSLKEAEEQSGESYFIEALAVAVRRVSYYEDEHHKECARVKWIDQLYGSLPA